MKNDIRIFENNAFGAIRTMQLDGQPWFVGKDVADILKYDEPHKAVTRLVDHEDRIKHPVLSQKGTQVTWIVNESGLYSLILSSKLPNARAFKRWVTGEVLPSIRKYGGYITGETLEEILADPDKAVRYFKMLQSEREKHEQLRIEKETAEASVTTLVARINEYTPKVNYYDIILQCDTPIPITVIAKDYGLSAVVFNKLLYSFKVQYSVGGTWVLYKEHSDLGYTMTKTFYVQTRNGMLATIHTYWLQAGRRFIYDLLRQNGILPLAERRESVG